MEPQAIRLPLTHANSRPTVVWARRGADRKALPPKNIIIIIEFTEPVCRVLDPFSVL